MNRKLINFINEEIETRNWTVTELARRAELAQPTVADVLNEKSRPGLRWYIGVSRALQCSVDHLLRLAEELPASVGRVDELSEEEGELLRLYRQLSYDDQQMLARMAQGMIYSARVNKEP